MKARVLATLGVVALLVTVAGADQPLPQLSDGDGDVWHGGVVGVGQAARDTTYLLGGPGRFDGKFQDAAGYPDWQGWTHFDATDAGARWNISTFQSPTGTPAMWCGQENFPGACGPGYGNGWNELLAFTYTVADAAANTVVRLQCICRWDTEPGYDYLRIQQNRGGTWETFFERDGVGTASFDQTITFTANDYVGPAGNQLELRFQGYSDGAFSDEDGRCSDGLAQVDDIRVTIGAEIFLDDFDDGASHFWTEVGSGCGDFAKIWQGLQDVDPCVSNLSPQVAFIDDGVVVPGTGGTPCITWCYGPGGYIVNWSGGLLGYPAKIDNLVISPPLAWPTGADGAILSYDVFRHEELGAESPAILYQWRVRSAVDREGLEDAPWEDRNHYYYGRGYQSDVQDVTDLLVPGRNWVQIGLRCFQYNPPTWSGGDGTPAPYFDNVAFKVFSCDGPAITAREIDLAQDDFPDRGDIDLANLANNWVRFDMAGNIAPMVHQHNDPGDSVVIDVSVRRAGAVLDGLPRMVVRMEANPVFDGVRQLPPGFTRNGNLIDGWVEGAPTTVADRYAFDLPDSTFFFPGDVIQYYFTAADNVNGNVGVTTLPDKLDGFGNYTGIMAYPNVFTVRALPTLHNASGMQPRILFWNDAPDRGRDAQWLFALNNFGYNEHWNYDIYETNAPTAGGGNGLGGRATPQTLGGYYTLLYTSGDLGTLTLGNNDYASDPSNDIGVLTNWFGQGGKKAFMTGDDLVASLTTTGAGLAFMNAYFSVRFVNGNILPLINNQTAPRVQPVAGNSVFTTPDEWIAFGGCLSINDFDAIETSGTAQRLARFLNPGGAQSYTYAAATRYVGSADVTLMPYDFSFIQNPPGYVPSHPGITVRAEVLRDILIGYGHIPMGDLIAVPEARPLTVTAGPNPFNPRTTIALDLPRAGEVALRLYDIRGRLVRTLHDGPLGDGRHELIWNGDDDTGRAMASGVYFYEVRAAGEERIGKLTLVR